MARKTKDEYLDEYLTKSREEFRYNPDNDPVAIAMKNSFEKEAKRQTEDTLGKVASVTGGVPSSFAVSAANQAGADVMDRYAQNIPALEQAAYERHQNDVSNALNRYNIAANAEASAEASKGASGQTYSEGTILAAYQKAISGKTLSGSDIDALFSAGYTSADILNMGKTASANPGDTVDNGKQYSDAEVVLARSKYDAAGGVIDDSTFSKEDVGALMQGGVIDNNGVQYMTEEWDKSYKNDLREGKFRSLEGLQKKYKDRAVYDLEELYKSDPSVFDSAEGYLYILQNAKNISKDEIRKKITKKLVTVAKSDLPRDDKRAVLSSYDAVLDELTDEQIHLIYVAMNEK